MADEYWSNGLRFRGDPEAPTGPLTPGQVACRVCNLDDRTRAASDPVDELCDVCRADTPNRIARKRREHLNEAVQVFVGMRDLNGRIMVRPAGEQTDLAIARANALLKLADIVIEHPDPDELLGSSRTNPLVEKAVAYAEKSKFGVPQDMTEALIDEIERLRVLLGVAGGRVWLAETRETRAVDEVSHLTNALTKTEERLTEVLADREKKGNDEQGE